MSYIIHPGPTWIDPSTAPGGIVLHCYSVPDQQLLFVQALCAGADVDEVGVEAFVEQRATQGAELAEAAGAVNVCLVAYDGDTGERIPLREWFPL
jgi:hypothetical protein